MPLVAVLTIGSASLLLHLLLWATPWALNSYRPGARSSIAPS